jgi:hypothetical protein
MVEGQLSKKQWLTYVLHKRRLLDHENRQLSLNAYQNLKFVNLSQASIQYKAIGSQKAKKEINHQSTCPASSKNSHQRGRWRVCGRTGRFFG